VLGRAGEITVVSTLPLLVDMIRPGQRDDEILRPRGWIAVAFEPRMGLSELAADRGDPVLRRTRCRQENRGENRAGRG